MSSESPEYDLVCIGAGSGGVRASRFSASQYGKRVAVVELPFAFVSSKDAGGAGGTCVIRGCVPKKLLVYGSSFAGEFEDARGFGWDLGPDRPPFDLQKLIANKGKEIQRLNGVYGKILGSAGVEQVEGRGVVQDPHTVAVTHPDGSTRRLTTKNILVATGSSAVRLDIPGAELCITSDEALMIEQLPATSIAIYGGGYIAVEFAGIFAGMGAEVHLFFRKPLPLTGFDSECRQQVADNLKGRGVHVHSGTHPVRVEAREGGGCTFTYSDGAGSEASLHADHVMMATGREPNSKGLGLREAGVALDDRSGAVKVDEYQRTSVPSVWALGDVTDKIQLTPVALMEGMAFAQTAFGDSPCKPDYELVPSAVFCQPPLALVGVSEEEAVAKYSGPIDVYVSKFKPMRNTLAGREEKTLMKMLVHASSDRVIGVHMVGDHSAEIMQGIAVAVKMGATKRAFDKTIGIHPSAAEEFVTLRSVTRTVEGKGDSVPE